MKTSLLTLLFIMILNIGLSQKYTFSWGINTYDTLENTSSLNPFSDPDIPFGFGFPFFDTTYSYVTIEFSGYGYFPNSPNYNFYLFAGDFGFHSPQSGIRSEWRYKLDMILGDSVLKVEWRNVGIWDDVLSGSPTDHRINFQVWFYQSGIIEMHFGETDLSNTPFYSDTAGFIWSNGESYGPWIEVGNFDFSEVYCISGDNNNIIVITDDDSCDIYYDIPVNGQYFRWVPDKLPGINTNKLSSIKFNGNPNPTSSSFVLDLPLPTLHTGKLTITDLQGRVVTHKVLAGNATVSVADLPAGIYLISVKDARSVYQTKIVVN